MPLFSDEEVKAVRLASAEEIVIPGIPKKLKLVKVSGSKATEIGQMQLDLKGKGVSRALFLLLFTSSVCREDGSFLQKEDAEQLFEVLPADVSFELVRKVTSQINVGSEARAKAVGNSEASPAAGSSSGSAST